MPPLQFIWNVSRSKRSKKFYFEYLLSPRITISKAVLRVDKANANDIHIDLTDACNNKLLNILNLFYHSFKTVSDKDSVHNTVFNDDGKSEKNWRQKGVFAAVLTDLSKAFDCIPHGLRIAKLNTFGFDKK